MRDSKFMFGKGLIGLSLAAAIFAGGCKREQVSSYQVPKEDHSVKPFSMAGMMGGSGMGNEDESATPATPQLKWDLPNGWKEKSGQQMGIGSFHVDGDDGRYADIRVIPLRAGPEIEQRSVNMWREELGLPELPVDQIKGDELNVAGAHGHLYDLKSDELKFGGKYKARTTAAILEKDDTLWFVKMAGEESIVSAQQDNFKNFLKSFRFESGGMPAGHPQVASKSAPGAGSGSGAGANWKFPATWQQVPAGQMVLASYKATRGPASADVTVTSFPGDVGGVLANVNRWRGQVGLGPINDADLAKETKSVDLADGSKAVAVDVTGKKRLYGLMVPRGGKTWFYKIIGDPEVVGAESANLVEFAATAH